jgi:hypothetical protein
MGFAHFHTNGASCWLGTRFSFQLISQFITFSSARVSKLPYVGLYRIYLGRLRRFKPEKTL